MFQKELPGARCVARDRCLQRRQAVVLLLVAQLLQEAHAQMLAIQVLVAVEQMHFEQRNRHRVDGGAPAHARHSAAETIDFDHEDPGDRRRSAPRRSPAWSAARTAELETRRPSNSTSSIASREKAWRFAAASSAAKSPAPPAP